MVGVQQLQARISDAYQRWARSFSHEVPLWDRQPISEEGARLFAGPLYANHNPILFASSQLADDDLNRKLQMGCNVAGRQLESQNHQHFPIQESHSKRNIKVEIPKSPDLNPVLSPSLGSFVSSFEGHPSAFFEHNGEGQTNYAIKTEYQSSSEAQLSNRFPKQPPMFFENSCPQKPGEGVFVDSYTFKVLQAGQFQEYNQPMRLYEAEPSNFKPPNHTNLLNPAPAVVLAVVAEQQRQRQGLHHGVPVSEQKLSPSCNGIVNDTSGRECCKPKSRASPKAAKVSSPDSSDKFFTCITCNLRFTSKGHLARHYRTHTGERPFTCGLCQKSFSRSGHLDRHIRIHSGERPFECGYCSKGFSRTDSLNRHLKTHFTSVRC